MNILFFLQKEGHRVAPFVRETVNRMNLRYLHIVIDHSKSPFICFTKQTARIALSKRLIIDFLPLGFLIGSTHEKVNAQLETVGTQDYFGVGALKINSSQMEIARFIIAHMFAEVILPRPCYMS
jgi:hypothetical protein